MTQISKFRLNQKVQERILRNLFIAISKINKERQSKLFLDDLLTRTEKVVLAKRLAIALLLQSGSSYSDIKDLIKVSASTISSVNNKLNTGKGYREVINKLLSVESQQKDSWLTNFLNSKASISARNKTLPL